MRNIIWVIVDSVRNYACPADRIDDRGRITLMDELAESWIDFRTVVTSAPSTVMSMAAMFTSCPSYYLGANFSGFKLADCEIPNIGSILKPYNYHSYYITLLANEREAWEGICEHVPRSVWADGLTHRCEWKNEKITETVHNLTQRGLKEPFFFMLHYNCRGDEKISENVRQGLAHLEDAGLMDNAVVFLTSDHGYPDPFRMDQVAELGKHAAFKHRRLPHDLVLTDDNILVPLLIRYPGHQPRRIEQQISTLDYLPTALDLAGIKEVPDLHGLSVVPLLEGQSMPELEDRKVRIDGRFMGQKGRGTAIRSATRKYIYYHDLPEDQREQFYDLNKDHLEIHNIIEQGAEGYESDVDQYRLIFNEEEEKGAAILDRFIKSKYLQQLNRFVPVTEQRCNRTVLFVKADAPSFNQRFEKILEEIHGSENIACIDLSEASSCQQERFDIVLGCMLEHFGNKELFKIMPALKGRKKLLMDLNTNLFRCSRFFVISLFRLDWQLRKRYYLREPLYLLGKIWTVLHRMLFGAKQKVSATDYDQVNKNRQASKSQP